MKPFTFTYDLADQDKAKIFNAILSVNEVEYNMTEDKEGINFEILRYTVYEIVSYAVLFERTMHIAQALKAKLCQQEGQHQFAEDHLMFKVESIEHDQNSKLLMLLHSRALAIDYINSGIKVIKYIREKSKAELELMRLGYDPSEFDHITYDDFREKS